MFIFRRDDDFNFKKTESISNIDSTDNGIKLDTGKSKQNHKYI